MRTKLIHDRLTHSVIGAFFEVYNTLGFGFLEHVYIAALSRELLNRGHEIGREVSVPVFYKGEEIAHQRLDMIVDRKLVVETKATRSLHEGAVPQVANYLRATNLELGLLLHFGPRPKFYRVICTNPEMPRTKSPLPPDPRFPPHPRTPSVVVASRSEPQC